MISNPAADDAKAIAKGAKGEGGDRSTLLQTTEELLKEEDKFLWPNGAPPRRAGLALSGGGVRAATVALGVLQTLAKEGLLSRFHYLSTVSGGGYIGSALSWFWCQKRTDEETLLRKEPQLRFGATSSDFPFQDPNPAVNASSPEDKAFHDQAVLNLAFLRNHGSYLTSGDGIGLAGLIVAALRTILLSVGVWLPLLVMFFVSVNIFEDLLGSTTCIKSDFLAAVHCRPVFKSVLFLMCGSFAAFYSAVVLFSFLGRLRLDSAVPTTRRRYARIASYLVVSVASLGYFLNLLDKLDSFHPAIGVQSVALVFLCVSGVMLACAEFFSPTNPGYFLRRTFERYSSVALPIVVMGMFIGSLPLIVASLKSAAGSTSGTASALGPIGGLVTLLSGIATALYGYYLKAKSLLPGIAGQILAISGALLFLSGLLLFSFVVAEELYRDGAHKYVLTGVLSLAVLAFLIGSLGSVNATGLHRFYRDRLMETFMPMTVAVNTGDARQSDVADNLSVTDIVRNADERGNRPYQIVNTHVILTNEESTKIALRGGDNFVISPAFVGSSATGWVRTQDYVDRHGPLTLASAMATSGAAANANAGYIGKGIARDRFVSAVMAILNVRLGLWVGNPRAVAEIDTNMQSLSQSKVPRIKPRVATYFWPVLTSGIFGNGYHSEATFLELSDGGHFENLGLYELVRRKLDLILVVDAEQDSSISLAALVSSRNRIKEDFGVEVRLIDAKGAEILLGQKSDRYPSGVQVAKSPYLIAKIVYPADDQNPEGREGVLIYIKSTMMKGLEFATEGYRAANPEFPHQSTADQFFDPDQFEAYRDLGRKSCALMVDELKLSENFESIDQILKEYVPHQVPGSVT